MPIMKCYQICISIPCNKSVVCFIHFIIFFLKMECFVLLCHIGEGPVPMALFNIINYLKHHNFRVLSTHILCQQCSDRLMLKYMKFYLSIKTVWKLANT